MPVVTQRALSKFLCAILLFASLCGCRHFAFPPTRTSAEPLLSPRGPESGSQPSIPGATAANQKSVIPEQSDSCKIAKKSGRLGWPVEGRIISGFGNKDGEKSNGIDILAPEGTPVKAAADGKVGRIEKIARFGNVVLIEHPNRLVTVYGHLKDIGISEGATVKYGQIIGTVGSSGRVDSPSLYFEVRSKSKPQNPLNYLERKA